MDKTASMDKAATRIKSSFETYLPNLMTVKISSRRWTTGFIFKDLSKNRYAAQNYVSLRTNPTKQVRSKRTSQIWRPSKNTSDAGPQVLFSRIYLKLNMRPKLCEPSREAHQTTSFKTYLPNLTAFKNSRRRWTTGFIFKDLSTKWICSPSYVSSKQKTRYNTFNFVRMADQFWNIWFCKGSGPILNIWFCKGGGPISEHLIL